MPHLVEGTMDFFQGDENSKGPAVVRCDKAPPPSTTALSYDTNDLGRSSNHTSHAHVATPNMNEIRRDHIMEYQGVKRQKKDRDVNTVTPMTMTRSEMIKNASSHGNSQGFQYPTMSSTLEDSTTVVGGGYNTPQQRLMMKFPNQNPSDNENTNASLFNMYSQMRQHPTTHQYQQQKPPQQYYMPFPQTASRPQVQVHPMMNPVWITTAAANNINPSFVGSVPPATNFQMPFPVYMTSASPSATQMNQTNMNIPVGHYKPNTFQQYYSNDHNTHGRFEGAMMYKINQLDHENHNIFHGSKSAEVPEEIFHEEKDQQEEQVNEIHPFDHNNHEIPSFIQKTQWIRDDYDSASFKVTDDGKVDYHKDSELHTCIGPNVHPSNSAEKKNVTNRDMDDSYDKDLTQMEESPCDSKPVRKKRISKRRSEQLRNERISALSDPSNSANKSPVNEVKKRIQKDHAMNHSSQSLMKCTKMTTKEFARYTKMPLHRLTAELEHNRSFEVPQFGNLLNYTSGKSEGMLKECGMCGELRPTMVRKEHSSKASKTFHIPSQNKGICTACDGAVWIINKNLIEIKWCKGCKNFRRWIDFEEKYFATKCGYCREKQREKYKEKCENREKQSLERALMYQKVKHKLGHTVHESDLNPLECLLAAASTQREDENNSDYIYA